VLKPVDDPIEAAWSAELPSRIEPSGFRLPQPLRSRDGRYVVDGAAHPRRPGRAVALRTGDRAGRVVRRHGL